MQKRKKQRWPLSRVVDINININRYLILTDGRRVGGKW